MAQTNNRLQRPLVEEVVDKGRLYVAQNDKSIHHNEGCKAIGDTKVNADPEI